MIDIERIEKAYLRFKLLHDSLVFRVHELKSDGKDQNGKEISVSSEPMFEVRCASRFIVLCKGSGAASEAKGIAAELNDILSGWLEKQYTKFLDEVIVSKTKLESSD